MSAQIKYNSEFPNVSMEKLSGGQGRFQAPPKMIKNSICSVLKAFANFENVSVIQASRSQIQIDAERLGISLTEYLVKLAFEHEKNQEHPNSDINIVIVRFITHLMKIRNDHTELIHDLQEVRESFNRVVKAEAHGSQNDFESHIIQVRLKSIFH